MLGSYVRSPWRFVSYFFICASYALRRVDVTCQTTVRWSAFTETIHWTNVVKIKRSTNLLVDGASCASLCTRCNAALLFRQEFPELLPCKAQQLCQQKRCKFYRPPSHSWHSLTESGFWCLPCKCWFRGTARWSKLGKTFAYVLERMLSSSHRGGVSIVFVLRYNLPSQLPPTGCLLVAFHPWTK